MCVKKKSTENPPPPTNLMEILNENEGLLLERISITFYPVIKHLGSFTIYTMVSHEGKNWQRRGIIL
jgi:hypothetical protein